MTTGFDVSKLQRWAALPLRLIVGYGFLGLVRGHKHFLKHVPAAMKSLHGIVAQLDGLTELEKTLRQLI